MIFCPKCKHVVRCASGTGMFCGHAKIGIYVKEDDTCTYAEEKVEN